MERDQENEARMEMRCPIFRSPRKIKSCDYSRPKWSRSKPLKRSNAPHTQAHGARNLPVKVPAYDHLTKAIPPATTTASEVAKNRPVWPKRRRISLILQEVVNLSEESEDDEGLPVESSIKVLKNNIEVSKDSEDKIILPVESSMSRTPFSPIGATHSIKISKNLEPVKPMSPVTSSSSDSSSEGSDSDSSSDNSSTDDSSTDDSSSDDSVDESDRLVSGPNNDIKDQRKRGSPAKCEPTSSIPKDKSQFGGQTVLKTSRLRTPKSEPPNKPTGNLDKKKSTLSAKINRPEIESHTKVATSHVIDKKKSEALRRIFNVKRRFKGGKGGGKEDKKANDKAGIRIIIADKLYEKSSSSVDNLVPSDPVVLISIPDSEMTRFETEGEPPQTSDDIDQIMTDTGDRIDIGKILCPTENIEFQNPDFACPDKVKLQTQSYYEQKNKENVEHKKREKSSDKQRSKTQLKKRERANSPASVLLSVGSTPGCSGANTKMTGFETEGKLPQTSDDIDQIMTDTGDRRDIGKIICPRENIKLQNPDFVIPDKVKLQTQSYYGQKNKENVKHQKRDKSSDKQRSKTQLKKRERANSPASVLLSVGSTPGCSGANKKIVHLKNKDDRQIKRRKTEENRSFSKNSSADAPVNSSSNAGAMRQHYSYFEKPTQRSDYAERCQNQYIYFAKTLKYMADRENDTITRWCLYLEAVLYFLLTGYAMEHESATKEAALTMYKNTLSLIRFISSKLKNRANQSPDHYKLAVLSYRCEAFMYYKLYQMKISEIEEHQKLTSQYPVRLSGNSTDLETRVKFNPAHVTPSDVSMHLSVNNAITEQNQNLTYLRSYRDLWNLADSLVANRNHADFFIQLDLHCKPLTNLTSLMDLLRYVQEGISRLQRSKMLPVS